MPRFLPKEIYQRAAENLKAHTGLDWKVVFESPSTPLVRREATSVPVMMQPYIVCKVTTDKPGREFLEEFPKRYGFNFEFTPEFLSLSYQVDGKIESAGLKTDHWGDFQQPGVEKTAEVEFRDESVISAIANGVFAAPTVTSDEIQDALRWLQEKTGVTWRVEYDSYGTLLIRSVDRLTKTEQDRLVSKLRDTFSRIQQPPFNRVIVGENSNYRGDCIANIYFIGSTAVKGILTAISEGAELSGQSQARPYDHYGMFAAGASVAHKAAVLTLHDNEGDNFVTGVTRDDTKRCYVIDGTNSEALGKQPRQIQIYDDGRVTGFRDSYDLGVVGKQIYTNREAIFKHFGFELPASHTPDAPSL